MTSSDNASPEFSTLEKRVSTDPDSVTLDDLIGGLLADPPSSSETAVDLFSEIVEADEAVTAFEKLTELHTPDSDLGRVRDAVVIDLAKQYPSQAQGAIDRLLTISNQETNPYSEDAFQTLEEVAAHHPEDVATAALPLLKTKISSDHYQERAIALSITGQIARGAPASVSSVLPELLNLIDQDRSGETPPDQLQELPRRIRQRVEAEEALEIRLRQIAALTTVEIARADPKSMAVHLDILLDQLHPDELRAIREATYDASWFVAQHQPATARQAIKQIADLIPSEDNPTARAKAVRTLAILADKYPETVTTAVKPVIDHVIELLDEETELAIGATVGLLAYVAEDEPSLVEPVTPRLTELLQGYPDSIRANAIWTLSFVGDDSLLEEINAVAEETSDEKIETLAEEAIQRIED